MNKNTVNAEEATLKVGPQRENLIPLLQEIQSRDGFISEENIAKVEQTTGISMAEIYGVVTFYQEFRTTPVGKYIIKVCDGTACHVNNTAELIACLEDILGVDENNDTTDDRLFTVQKVACLGCCSLAPVITINDQTHGRLNPSKLRNIIKGYQNKSNTNKTENVQ